MQNRDYKIFAQDEYYHIYNRGTGKMDLFKDEEDYTFFLSRLREYIFPEERRRAPSARSLRYVRKEFSPGAFTLVCYCLMPNHYHFVLRQNGEESISTLMLNFGSGYSKYFNRKYDRVGSVFQDQFKAVRIDSNEYLLWLSAYVHQNPTVGKLVKSPEQYRFSSYIDYIGKRGGTLCDKQVILDQFKDPHKYVSFVADSLEAIKARKDLESLLID